MKSKIVLLLCALSMVSFSFGGVVIGDFEGSTDAWTLSNGATGAYVTGDGVTLGSNALEVTSPGGWVQAMIMGTGGLESDLAAATKITADVTLRDDNNQIPEWWLQIDLVINSNAGWISLAQSGLGGVTWGPTTYNVEFTVPQAVRDTFAANSWGQMVLSTNSGAAPYKMVIDNIQIVPEPATLVMLGLGALMSLKRRKA